MKDQIRDHIREKERERLSTKKAREIGDFYEKSLIYRSIIYNQINYRK